MSGKVPSLRSGSHLESGEALLVARGLPPDLLRLASRRLELASLVLAAAYSLALVLTNIFRATGWRPQPHFLLHNIIALTLVSVSMALFWLCRRGRLEPIRLLDLGLLYEVMVALGISLQDNLAPLSPYRPLDTVSWLFIWIVMFPVIVPAPPAKALMASLAAASTWPVAFAAGLALGNPSPPTPVVALTFLENYFAVVLALVTTLVMRRLGAHVQKAREMGSYELVERLGQGGMGEVWRARHKMLARPAAIKLIRPQALGLQTGPLAERLLRRFEREAQATAALHSPHSVELYDFGVTADGTFYYVMEILEGLDLEALVRRFGPVPAERAIHLLLQVCDSLADAHHAGLVHRDIKPANIYACRKGLKHDFVKVLDFGLVKSTWVEEDDDISELTQEGAVPGTPGYIAPEVALGDGRVDGRADLYAVGCVGYWLLTGHRVFESGTPMQVAIQHVQAAPVAPSRRTDLQIPQLLERAIMACLEKAPERRPTDAADLADRLAGCDLETGWNEQRARCWWDTHLPVREHPGVDPATTTRAK
jgi:eukaryotic-like serine/threonine-protein kinase